MQRLKPLRWAICVIILLSRHGGTKLLESTTPKSFSPLELIAPKGAYFLMNPNGSYKYAFETASGIASEQSANQANEVTGQYSYIENGVPFMVKYKAGIRGYQAEIIPGGGGGGSASASLGLNKRSYSAAAQLIDATSKPEKATTTTPTIQPLPNKASRLSDRSTLSQGSGGDSGKPHSGAATLQFVKDMVRTMRSQPIQLSFSSQQVHLQHGFPLPINAVPGSVDAFGNRRTTSNTATRLLPQNNVAITTNNADARAINSLGSLAADPLKQPYAFSYSTAQSARSESADQSGNVVGKYSYYDEAGFHELNYKAGDDIGFVVFGQRDAAKQQTPTSSGNEPFLPVNAPQSRPSHPNYGYSILPLQRADSKNIRRSANVGISSSSNRNTFEQNGRSLRKFRRHVKS